MTRQTDDRGRARQVPWTLDAGVLAQLQRSDADLCLPAARLRQARRATPEGFTSPPTGRLFASILPVDVRLVAAEGLVLGAGGTDATATLTADPVAAAASPNNVVPRGMHVLSGRGCGIALSNGIGPHPLSARLEAFA